MRLLTNGGESSLPVTLTCELRTSNRRLQAVWQTRLPSADLGLGLTGSAGAPPGDLSLDPSVAIKAGSAGRRTGKSGRGANTHGNHTHHCPGHGIVVTILYRIQ